MQSNWTKLCVQSNRELSIYGDTDVLVTLQFFQKMKRLQTNEVLSSLGEKRILDEVLGKYYFNSLPEEG